MMPKQSAPLVAGVLTGMFVMSGVVTGVNTRLSEGYVGRRPYAWQFAWSLAVPLATVMPRLLE